MADAWDDAATAVQQQALQKPTQFDEILPDDTRVHYNASDQSPVEQPALTGPKSGMMMNIGQDAQGHVTGQYGGDPWQQESARLNTAAAMARGENLVPYLQAEAKIGPGLDNSRQQTAYASYQKAQQDSSQLTSVGGNSPNAVSQAVDYPTWQKLRHDYQVANPNDQLPPDLQVWHYGLADQQTQDAANGSLDRPLLHDETLQHDARVAFGKTNPGQQLPSSIQGTAEQRLQAQQHVMADNIRAQLGPAWNNLPDNQVVAMHDEQVAGQERLLAVGAVRALLPKDTQISDDEIMQAAQKDPMLMAGVMQKALLPQLAAQAQQRQTQREKLGGPLPNDTPDTISNDSGLVNTYLTQQLGEAAGKRLFPGAPALGDFAAVTNSAGLGLPGLIMRHFQGASDLVARGVGGGPGAPDQGTADPRNQMWTQMEQGYKQAHPLLSAIDSTIGYMLPIKSPASLLGKALGPATSGPIGQAILASVGGELRALPAAMIAKAAGGAIEMPFYSAVTTGVDSGSIPEALKHLDPKQPEFWQDAATGFAASGATHGVHAFVGDGLGMIASSFGQYFKTRPSIAVELRPDASPEQVASFQRVQAAWDLTNHDGVHPADALKRAGVTADDLATVVDQRAGYAKRVVAQVIDTQQNPWKAESDGVDAANQRNAETAAAQPETRLAPGNQPIHPSDFKPPMDPYEGLNLTEGDRRVMASVERAENQLPPESRKWAQDQIAALHPDGVANVEHNPAATAQIVEQAHDLVAEHPAELQDAAAVGRWYGATFKDPMGSPIIETLAGLGEGGKGKYVQALVPPSIVNTNSVMAGDINEAKASEIASKSHMDRANMPPAIFVDGDNSLTSADGSHRLAAAVKAGDPFIRAYVPEHWLGKDGVRRVGEAAPIVAQEHEASPGAPGNTKTQPSDLERRGGLGGNEPWELTREQFLHAAPVERGESMTIRKAGSTLVPAMRIAGKTYANPHAQTHGHVLTDTELERLDPGMKAIPGYVRPGSSEFIYQFPEAAHKAEVQGALNRGENVPADVRADYPNLKKETASAATLERTDSTGQVTDATGTAIADGAGTAAGRGRGELAGTEGDIQPREDAGTAVDRPGTAGGETRVDEATQDPVQAPGSIGESAVDDRAIDGTGRDVEAGAAERIEAGTGSAETPRAAETLGDAHGPGVTEDAIKSAFADSSGPLDPARPADALKIYARAKGYKRESFTPAQRAAVDEAFRTLAKPVAIDTSTMPDMKMWATPEQMEEASSIAAEAAKIAGRKHKFPGYYKPKGKGKPYKRAIPKPAKSADDVLKLAENFTGGKFPNVFTALDGRRFIATDGSALLEVTNKDMDASWRLTAPKEAMPAYEEIMPRSKPATTVYAPEAIRRLRQAEIINGDQVQVVLNRNGSLGFAAADPNSGQAEVNVNEGGTPLGYVDPVLFRNALEAHIVAGHDAPKMTWTAPNKPMLLESSTHARGVRTLLAGLKAKAPAPPETAADDGTGDELAQESRMGVEAPGQLREDYLYGWKLPDEHVGGPSPSAAAKKQQPPGAPRITIDPLPDGDPRQLREIILDLGRAVGKQVRQGAKMPRAAGGVYFPGSTRTAVRFSGDLDITAHEIGHMLDDRWGIVSTWAGSGVKSPFDDELIPNFSAYGSGTKSGPRSKISYVRAEGVAEWVRAFIVNPSGAIAAAPKFSQWFKSQVSPADYENLKEFSKDVRRWAGLSNAERVTTNIRMANERTPIMQRVRNFLTGGDEPGLQMNAFDQLVTNFADDLHPIVKGIEFLKRVRPEITEGEGISAPAADAALARLRNYAGEEPKLLDIIDNGPIRFQPKDPGKAFERAPGIGGGADWLLGKGVLGMDNLSWDEVQRRHQMAAAYLDSQRVVEKAGQIRKAADELIKKLDPKDPKYIKKATRIAGMAESRISRMAGWGGGIFNDESTAKNALNEIASSPVLHDQVKEIAERYRAWGDANLKYMLDGGRLSKQSYDLIKASNEFYSDMHRVIDPIMGVQGAGSRRLGSVSQPLQKFKGSTRQLENPFVGLLRATSDIVKETDRNAALDAFTDLARSKRNIYEGKPLDLDAVASRGRPGDRDTISVYHKGERQEWNFAPDIHRALKGFGDRPEQSLALRIASLLLKRIPQHALATYNPQFWIRQMFRTTGHLLQYSKSGATPMDIVRGRSDEDRTAMRLQGGDMGRGVAGTAGSFRNLVEQRLRSLSAENNTVLAIPGRAFRSVERAAMHLSGGYTRGIEYRRAYEQFRAQGYRASDASMMAAGKSRELIDYAIGGRLVKSLDRFIPFLNAGVQHSLRMPRAFKSNPGGSLMRLALYGIVPSILAYLWNSARGTVDEWRQLPAWRRDFALNFKVGHVWLSIPMPYEVGVASNAIVRALDGVIHGSKVAPFSDYPSSVKHGVAHFDEAMGLAGPAHTLMELKANHSDFFGRSIIPPGDEGKAMELREGSQHASRLAKWLSDAMSAAGLGADPRKVDYFLSQTLGGTEHMAAAVSDLGRSDKPGLANLALSASGIATTPPAYTARSVQELMDLAKKLGEDQSPEMMAFNKLLHAQASAPDLASKDKLAEQVRVEGQALLEHYQENQASILGSKTAVMADRASHRDDRPLGSPAERLAEALAAAKSSGQPQTMAQRLRIDAEQNYADTLRTDPVQAGVLIERYVRDGVLRVPDVKRLQERATLPRIQEDISGLDANDAMRVWGQATPAEQVTIRPFILEKVGRSQTLDQPTRLRYLRTLGVQVEAPS